MPSPALVPFLSLSARVRRVRRAHSRPAFIAFVGRQNTPCLDWNRQVKYGTSWRPSERAVASTLPQERGR